MPLKNQDSYLEECLQSIEGQRFKDWELVVVDDHSKDNSRLKIGDWAKRDSRIRVFENKGTGLSDSLNLGIERAQADLIARMDADDVMTSDRLKKQFDFLSVRNRVGLVGCRVNNLNDSNDVQFRGYKLYVEWLNSVKTFRQISLNRFVESPLAHPSVLFRKELILRFGGYKKGLFPEDYELWLRWLEAGVVMEKLDDNLLHWRDHKERASRTMPNYTKEAFQRVKAKYCANWLKAELAENFPISAWRAGRVARSQVYFLQEQGIEISRFYDVDPKKIGTRKNGILVHSNSEIPSPGAEFLLILCGARKARRIIEEFLAARGYELGKNHLFLA